MKNFFLAAFLLLSTCTASAPVMAQSCDYPVASFIETAKSNDLRILSMKGDVMKNFMAFLTSALGPPPIEYDEVLVINDGRGAKVSLVADGCVLMSTRTFPYEMIQPFMKEAGLEQNGT